MGLIDSQNPIAQLAEQAGTSGQTDPSQIVQSWMRQNPYQTGQTQSQSQGNIQPYGQSFPPQFETLPQTQSSTGSSNSNTTNTNTNTNTSTTLDQVPNPQREDFYTTTKPSVGDYLGTLTHPGGLARVFEKGGVTGKEGFVGNARDKYLKAKTERVLKIAELAGATSDEQAALKQQLAYSISQLPKTGDAETDLAAAEKVLTDAETPYAQQSIQNTATGTNGSGAEKVPGVYSPEQIANIQSVIGQFMEPYAKQAHESGTNAAAILNSFAGQSAGPYQGLIKSQAGLAQSAGDNIAAAYMRQAQALPAIQALESQQGMAQQIQSLQNQLLAQQQSNNSGLGSNPSSQLLTQLGGS